MFRVALVALAMAVSPFAFANTDETVALDLAGSFAEQHDRIRAELADGETYSEISAADRTQVTQALDRIATALEGIGSVEQLSVEEKVKVHNDQEVVNTILTSARADSRMICKREKKVGSHRPTTLCLTVAQRREALDKSQETLQRGQRTIHPLDPLGN